MEQTKEGYPDKERLTEYNSDEYSELNLKHLEMISSHQDNI